MSRNGIFVSLLAIFLPGTLGAQTDRGIIAGNVRDTTGAVVPGAAVTARHVATNVTAKTVTTDSGDYTVPSLPLGEYEVIVEKVGFQQSVHRGVAVLSGATATVDSVLQVGTTLQSIVISADIQMLETQSSRVNSQVTTKMVDELPLVVGGDMRSPFNLATITPQVSGSDNMFRIGGGQGGSWGIQLDGVSANTNRFGNTTWASTNSPSLEAITEFNVETSGFKAEFGSAGGGRLTFISKSGTNQFHGSAYDFARNDALDARGFFAVDRGIYKQHDFGASAGGPVYLPKLYNGRDRTFFFWTYEGFRNRVGAARTPRGIPPDEFYDGDFRNNVRRDLSRVLIYDPTTTRKVNNVWIRDPFPDNRIPVARFDPLAKAILPYGREVKSNRPEVLPGSWEYVWENYYAGGVALRPVNKTSVKLDHNLGAAHRLAFLFNFSRRSQVPGPDGPPGLPGMISTFDYNYQQSYVYRASWDYTITPRLLNRFTFGVNNWDEIHTPISASVSWKDKVCMKNVPNCDEALHRVNHDYGTWGGYSANGSFNPLRSYNDDLTFITGKHTFKTGYMYERAFYDGFGRQAIMGETWYARTHTAVPLEPNATIGGGSAFASFLLGYVQQASVETPRIVNMLYASHAMYFQDDWRVTKRLTLNLGLRYEFTRPPSNKFDQLSDFDPTRPNPAAGGRPGALIFAGFGEGRENRRTLIPGWWGGIGPRFGFAFAADSKTVFRGSASRSFAPVKNTGSSTHFQGFIQMVRYSDGTGGLEPLLQLSNGMLPYPLPPFINPSFANEASPYYWQGNEAVRAPENLAFNFNIQRQIAPGMLLEAGYSGMMGTHLVASLLAINQTDINRLPPELSIYHQTGRNLLLSRNFNDPALVRLGITRPYATFNDTVARSLKPYPQYLDIDTDRGGGDHSGHSTYHALVVKLTRNFSNGLMLNGSYVLSKWFTDAEQWGGGDVLDHYNRRIEKALAGSDKTHEVKLNYIYELPVGRGKRWLSSGLASRVIGGWRVGAVHYYSGGTPMALAGAYSFPIIGNRPYITTYENWRNPEIKGHGGTRFDPYVDNYFQPRSFFPEQPRDRPGNMTRNNPKLRSEPSWNENVSLAKTFQFGETFRLDARLEAFNLLNRVRFGNPNNNLNAVAFGLVRGQGNSARNMQVGLKLYW